MQHHLSSSPTLEGLGGFQKELRQTKHFYVALEPRQELQLEKNL